MHAGRTPLSRAGVASPSARRPGRLVPRGRVPSVVALAASGALVTGLLGGHVGGGDRDTPVDHAIESAVHAVAPMRGGAGGLLGEAIADIGSPIATVVLMAALAALAHLRCGPRALALVLVGPPIAMLTTSAVLKPLVGRTRGHELAYPSGHMTSSTSIAVALLVIVLSSSLPAVVRRWSPAVLGVVPLAVAGCLVGRGYHYPTDTVGALGVALVAVLLTAVVVDAVADRCGTAPPPGFEPGSSEPKSEVLPLHHGGPRVRARSSWHAAARDRRSAS